MPGAYDVGGSEEDGLPFTKSCIRWAGGVLRAVGIVIEAPLYILLEAHHFQRAIIIFRKVFREYLYHHAGVCPFGAARSGRHAVYHQLAPALLPPVL